jgi:hypothetical protein
MKQIEIPGFGGSTFLRDMIRNEISCILRKSLMNLYFNSNNPFGEDLTYTFFEFDELEEV